MCRYDRLLRASHNCIGDGVLRAVLVFSEYVVPVLVVVFCEIVLFFVRIEIKISGKHRLYLMARFDLSRSIPK